MQHSDFRWSFGIWMREIEISTARTTIRSFEAKDASEVFACISPEITRFMAWEPPPTEEAFSKVWQAWPCLNEGTAELYFVPRQRDGGRCLGIVAAHALQSATPELGIWLRHDVHGQGLGREVIGAVMNWVSQTRPVRYFEYPVAEDNHRSRRIAEAYGGDVRERRTNPKYSSVVYHIPSASSRRP